MTHDEFTKIVNEQMARSTDVLTKKAQEYATEDRLHNFKVAATLLNETPAQALSGFMAKHIVSVYDMCNSGREYPTEVWNEKIGDAINYLLLLRAMVEEKV